MTKADLLKEVIDLENFRVIDFWMICPYEPVQLLVYDKSEPLNTWRKMGMCWYVLSGLTTAEAGSQFERDHASVIHAISTMTAMLQVNDPLVTETVAKMKALSFQQTNALGDRQPSSAIQLESYLFGINPNVYADIHIGK